MVCSGVESVPEAESVGFAGLESVELSRPEKRQKNMISD